MLLPDDRVFAFAAAGAGAGAGAGEFFPSIKKIAYEGPKSTNSLAFKHYNANEVVHGRPMKDWLRFSVCYWHTFRGNGADPFGFPTLIRAWDDNSGSVENALRRVRMAFEFFTKLGVEYYTFHDRDVAPEGATLAETNANLDTVTDLMLQLQGATGVKLLWGTANMFSHRRYMHGAATNPNAHVFACAAAQVKKAMEVTHKLGGVNYVFWGGREGYQSVLNADVRRELDNMAAFFRMAMQHKANLGAGFQFLIEPKPREPTKHQYDYDAQTVMGFLHHYGLQNDFKLNIEPNHTTLAGHDYEHDIMISARYGMLGSVDSNTGDPLLGWDTDQFPMDVKKCTLVMLEVLEMGGLAPGGLNFDCKVRRESTDVEDMFIAHIGAMDAFARGLKNAAAILANGELRGRRDARYTSYGEGLGAKIAAGTATFDECEAFVHKQGTNPDVKSGKQEQFEMLLNDFC